MHDVHALSRGAARRGSFLQASRDARYARLHRRVVSPLVAARAVLLARWVDIARGETVSTAH